MTDEKIKNSSELEFAVFCIENVAAKLGVDAERVYQAFTEQSDILNGYIVPEYEVLHTQSREYIVDDLLDVMKERGDRPKTKNSILKVEDNIQYTTIKRNNMVLENDLTVRSGIKVENDDQSKIVFGRAEGGALWIFGIV